MKSFFYCLFLMICFSPSITKADVDLSVSPPCGDFSSYVDSIGPSGSFTFNSLTFSDPVNPIIAYSWNFGDGTVSTLVAPTHILSTTVPNGVCLTLTFTDGSNCQYCKVVGPSGTFNSCFDSTFYMYSMFCPLIYAPVCACGVQFSNSCMALNAGYTSWVVGECPALACTATCIGTMSPPGTYTFEASTTGIAPFTYTWTSGGTPFSSSATASLTTTGLQNICLDITDATGCIATYCQTYDFGGIGTGTPPVATDSSFLGLSGITVIMVAGDTLSLLPTFVDPSGLPITVTLADSSSLSGWGSAVYSPATGSFVIIGDSSLTDTTFATISIIACGSDGECTTYIFSLVINPLLTSGGMESLYLSGFQLYPNPALESITLANNSVLNNNTKVEIITVFGVVIKSYDWAKSSGTQSKSIAINDLASGVYFVKLSQNNKMTALRFVKK